MVQKGNADGIGSALKLLFIGNSYIYYNDLPRMLESMASVSDIPLLTGVVAGGGFSLEKHIGLGNVQPALEGLEPATRWSSSKRVVRVPPISGSWDWVILQEHSMRPLENPEKLFESANSIASAVKAKGSMPVLLVTWARQYAPEAQPDLTRAITDTAKKVGAQVVNAGDAWQTAIREGFVLHLDDASHPNASGWALCANCRPALTNRPPPPG